MEHYTVGDAARIARVTIRTLHHYDAVGLLVPHARSAAGYRLYTDADLHRLYQILFYREVGFSLEEIRSILDGEEDEASHLRRQEEHLLKEQSRLAAMLSAVKARLRAHDEGRELTMHDHMELFGDWSQHKYADEAHERWGDTDAYRESARRTETYGPRDWEAIRAEGASIDAAWVQLQQAGAAPADAASMEVAERHRQHLIRWFYDCPPAFHRGLGRMYVDDARFRARYDEMAADLAAFVRDAIEANADRLEANRQG